MKLPEGSHLHVISESKKKGIPTREVVIKSKVDGIMTSTTYHQAQNQNGEWKNIRDIDGYPKTVRSTIKKANERKSFIKQEHIEEGE